MKVRCSYCKNYIDKNVAVKRSVQSFCSEEHFYEYVKKNRKKQIVKYKKKNEDFSFSEKLEIIKLDEYRCRFCGTEYNLHVQHLEHHDVVNRHRERRVTSSSSPSLRDQITLNAVDFQYAIAKRCECDLDSELRPSLKDRGDGDLDIFLYQLRCNRRIRNGI
jgi:hypothetical protein